VRQLDGIGTQLAFWSGYRGGWFHETGSPSYDQWSFKIEKAEEIQEAYRLRKHCAAIYGVAQPSETIIRGRIVACHAMRAGRQILTWSVYFAATTMTMVGWIWALFEGLEWALGV
jgi:hypothetical protein